MKNEAFAVYIDHGIFSTRLLEHIEKPRSVFERLKSSNFKVLLDRSEFLSERVDYLVHVMTSDGAKPFSLQFKPLNDSSIPKYKKTKGFFLT